MSGREDSTRSAPTTPLNNLGRGKVGHYNGRKVIVKDKCLRNMRQVGEDAANGES